MDTRELQVVIKGDASDFKKAMGDVEQKSGGLKNALDNATTGSVALLGGLVAVGVGLAATVHSFTESENVAAQLDAVLRSTGGAAGVTRDSAIELSKALQKQTTYSDEAVLSAENLLLTFTAIGKDIMPQATETVLDMSTALGQDTKSSAVQLGKALQDPILGITALRRVGVNFSEDQKTVIENLVKTGNKAEAQRLILKELNTEFGGSARNAAQTFAGSMAQLGNVLDDVMEVIGSVVVDALDPLIGAIQTWIYEAGGAEAIGQKLVAGFEALKPYFPLIAGAIIGGLIPAFVALGAAIWGALAPLLPFIAAGAAIGLVVKLIVDKLGGWDATMQKMQPVIDWFKQAWEQIVNIWNQYLLPALKMLWNEFETKLLPALQKLWAEHGPEIIKVLEFLAIFMGVNMLVAIGILIGALYVLINVLSAVVNAVTWVGSEIKRQWQMMSDAWTGTVTGIQISINMLVAFFNALPQNIGFAIGAVTRWFIMLPFVVAGMVNDINAWLNTLPGRAYNALASMVNTISAWFNTLPGRAQATGQSLVSGFIMSLNMLPGLVGGIFNNVVNTVSSWAGAMFDRAKNIAGRFWEGFKQGLGIHSPSYIEKAFMAIGLQSTQTLAQMDTDMNKLNNISFGNFNTLLGPGSAGNSSTTNNNSATNNRIDVTIMGNAGSQEVQDGLLGGLRLAQRGI
jgi:hypothetical protein